ncbi:hypothetical protein [Pseudomonas sp. NPDC088444]|uniref:hypothetical protein n=1 Tax=Pseudomonas sp. NPDC088444 TaxID=3364456 RepID=UPI00384C4B8C
MKNSRTETVYIEYPRFKFPGVASAGTCFLKVWVRPSGLVVLCSQLLEYYGTSVTNAVEDILVSAIKQIHEDIGLDHLVTPTRWWKFGADHESFVSQVVRRTVWIEHYPPGAGLNPAGSLAFVAFDKDLHPVWNYVSKERAAGECGVDPAHFEVDPRLLKYES